MSTRARLRRAFVAGAQWGYDRAVVMDTWPSDEEAEAEASERYPDVEGGDQTCEDRPGGTPGGRACL